MPNLKALGHPEVCFRRSSTCKETKIYENYFVSIYYVIFHNQDSHSNTIRALFFFLFEIQNCHSRLTIEWKKLLKNSFSCVSDFNVFY